MKILIFGGISQSIVGLRGDLIKEMIKRGHQVSVASGEPEEGYVQTIQSWGVSYHPMELNRRGINAANDWIFYKRCRQIIEIEKPELVFSYNIKPVIYGSLAARGAGVPKISALICGAGAAQEPTNAKEFVISKISRLLYRFAFRGIQTAFFQNPDDEQLFRRCSIVKTTRCVQVAGSGIDLQTFSYSQPPTEPVVFTLIARLLIRKGVLDFLEAARQLKDEFRSEVSFQLIGTHEKGTGTIPKEILSKAEKDGIVSYLGNLADVRPALNETSVYVLPSFYGEGTPRTILEAMAIGRPIITTDSPGCRETVRQGVNGYLVATKSPADLALSMKHFVLNKSDISRMGIESRKLAEQVYDVKVVNSHMLDALEAM